MVKFTVMAMVMAFGEAACTKCMFNLSNKNNIAIFMIKDHCFLCMGLEEAYLGPYQIYSIYNRVFWENITLLFSVARCVGHNIDLPSNSIILKAVRVTLP